MKLLFLGQILSFFFLVYMGVNYLSSLRSDLHAFYFDFELSIPLIAWMIIPYSTVYIAPIMALLLCHKEDLLLIRKTLMAQIIVAAIFYLFFPAKLGFVRRPVLGFFAKAYEWLYIVDYPHNLLPSLHVGFTLTWVLVLKKHLSSLQYLALLLWALLVCFSVVLTHQHHILDIVSGLMLSSATYFWAKKKN